MPPESGPSRELVKGDMASAHLIVSRLVFAAGGRRDPKAPLHHLDLEVGEGRCVAVMGPGAAPLLALLAGLRSPERGCILLDGREVRGVGPDRVLVSPKLRPWFSAYRHVRRAVEPVFKGQKSNAERDAWTRHILRLCGLEHAMDLRPAQLSEGMRQRVALARALAQDPKILLLDNPNDGLVGDTREGLQDTFLITHERLGHTVVFATDDLDEAVLLADRVVVLTGGVAAQVPVDLMRPRVRIDLCRNARYLQHRGEVERLLKAPWTSSDRRRPAPMHGPPEGSEVLDLADRRRRRLLPAVKSLEGCDLRLGFVPLTDCAPLAIAKEEGFFAGYGLKITLSRETSWQNVRDKLAMGLLDGAQMPAAIPLAAGCERTGTPLVTAMSLGLGGNGITVSAGLYDEMQAAGGPDFGAPLGMAAALERVVAANRRARRPRLVFAVVAPHSSQNYLLRYWMASAGIHPDRDVRLVVVPPPQMVNYLKAGLIAGYCVGDPWNAVATRAGIGHTVTTSHEIWNHHPEKVFAVTRNFAETHPNTHEALLKALLDACWWIEQPDHEPRVIEVLSRGRYVNVPRDLMVTDAPGSAFDGTLGRVWHRSAANFPWRSHAVWTLTQMLRWGQIARPIHLERIATEVYRADIYRAVAKARGVAAPSADFKREGEHEGSWVLADGDVEMGPDRFMDGRVFDSEDPIAYLEHFELAELAIDLEALAVVNAEPVELAMGRTGSA